MAFRRALRGICLLILVAGSAWSCYQVKPLTEPLTPAVVAARWETIPLAHPRRWPTATLLSDGRVLVTGKDYSNSAESTVATEIYDPSVKAFTLGPEVRGRLGLISAAPIAEGVLITGGGASVSVIDVARNDVSSVGLQTVVPCTMTPLLDGTILFAGGGGRGNNTIAQIYDPRTRRLARTGDILVKRFDCPATRLKDGRVLLTGGTSSDDATYNKRIADAEIYDPVARSFTKTGSMKRSRWGHTSTLLPNGRVLITGGINEEEGETATAELYDPTNGVFREISPMRLPRSSHAAVILADGRVLITGGASHIGTRDLILRSAEIFDPATERFLETEPMGTARQDHSATLLKTGEVLIVGGWTGVGSARTGELFRPGK